MTYREHVIRWQEAFENRGTLYMVHLLQELLDTTECNEEDVQKELDKWLEIKNNTRIYGTRHSEAWAKSDMLREMMRWYGLGYEFPG